MSKVLDRLSKVKPDKYETHGKMKYPDLQMKALIFDTLGGLSTPAIRLMNIISKSGHLSLTSNRDPVKIANHAIASISVAIQVDNTAILMSSFTEARSLFYSWINMNNSMSAIITWIQGCDFDFYHSSISLC